MEWCRFQRPSVSHNLDFKVTVLGYYRCAYVTATVLAIALVLMIAVVS